MSISRILLAVLFVTLGPVSAHAGSNSESPDHYSAKVEYDSAFELCFFGAWSRQFSENFSAKTRIEIFPAIKSMALEFRMYYNNDILKAGGGIGTSFGKGSFGIPHPTAPERNKYLIGRDVIAHLSMDLTPSNFWFSASGSIWIPTQESHNTALWVMYATVLAAYDFQSWKLGPFFEPLFFKEGQGAIEALELRIGGYLEKSFGDVSFALFAGYDPYERASYLGAPKHAGYIGRGSFEVKF